MIFNSFVSDTKNKYFCFVSVLKQIAFNSFNLRTNDNKGPQLPGGKVFEPFVDPINPLSKHYYDLLIHGLFFRSSLFLAKNPRIDFICLV